MSTLNLLDVCRTGTHALGPGLRYAVWTQGCPFHCDGCITPEGREMTDRMVVSVEDLAADICLSKAIDGITISGGEPFLQADALSQLLRIVRERRPNLSVILFTGYLFQDLQWNQARNVLSYVDLLIDGPYIPTRNDGIGLRGSSNQRLHFLTDRLINYMDELNSGPRKNEIYIHDTYQKTIGIPFKKSLL